MDVGLTYEINPGASSRAIQFATEGGAFARLHMEGGSRGVGLKVVSINHTLIPTMTMMMILKMITMIT